MKIVSVIENLQDEEQRLCHEHGLCLYIEADSAKFLFDTGASEAFIKNAQDLGIDVKNVEFAILSHGHHDHSGGLLTLFRENEEAPVYMKQEALGEFFAKEPSGYRANGTDPRVLAEFGNRIRFIKGACEVAENVFLIANIPHNYPTPEGNRLLYTKKDGEILPDDFAHELLLIVREKDGIVVFSGCSHNGIENMLDVAKSQFKGEKIKAVIGGFHLIRMPKSACDNAIKALAQRFDREKIEHIYTCHCTGIDAFNALKEQLGKSISYFQTGKMVEL
ncbi:MAG: MBL fold metallo-hydrolase [Alphaproteobacteria bacterium]|nr:MBL fold metallo-hydrolase [Alphaproteobacteria bacterium]